jgi:hypothetical protein
LHLLLNDSHRGLKCYSMFDPETCSNCSLFSLRPIRPHHRASTRLTVINADTLHVHPHTREYKYEREGENLLPAKAGLLSLKGGTGAMHTDMVGFRVAGSTRPMVRVPYRAGEAKPVIHHYRGIIRYRNGQGEPGRARFGIWNPEFATLSRHARSSIASGQATFRR